MVKVLPPWCKHVKKKMIDLDMNVEDLAAKIDKTRGHTSAVINGRLYSEPTIKAISDVLNIQEVTYTSEETAYSLNQ